MKRCYGIDRKVIECDWEFLSKQRTVRAPHQPMPRLIDLLDFLAKPGLESIWLLLDIKVCSHRHPHGGGLTKHLHSLRTMPRTSCVLSPPPSPLFRPLHPLRGTSASCSAAGLRSSSHFARNICPPTRSPTLASPSPMREGSCPCLMCPSTLSKAPLRARLALPISVISRRRSDRYWYGR